MKFELSLNGNMRGDCTAPYKVIITESGTLKDFIDEVLVNRKEEWGYIGIRSNSSCFGNPRMEYRHGEPIDRETLAQYENQKIKSVKADGGWTNMNYVVDLEAEVE